MAGRTRFIPFVGLMGFGAVSPRRPVAFLSGMSPACAAMTRSPTQIEELPLSVDGGVDIESWAAESAAYQQMVTHWLGRNQPRMQPRQWFVGRSPERPPPALGGIGARDLRLVAGGELRSAPQRSPQERVRDAVAQAVVAAAHSDSWVDALLHGAVLKPAQQAAVGDVLQDLAATIERIGRPARPLDSGSVRKRAVANDFDAVVQFWATTAAYVATHAPSPMVTQWLLGAFFGYFDFWRDLGGQLPEKGGVGHAESVVGRAFERLRGDLWRRLQNRIGHDARHDRVVDRQRSWANGEPVDLTALQGLNGRGPQGVWAPPPVAASASAAASVVAASVSIESLAAVVAQADPAVQRLARVVVGHLKQRKGATPEQSVAVRRLLAWLADAGHRADVQQVLRCRGEAALLHLFAWGDLPPLQCATLLRTMATWAQTAGHQGITFTFEGRGKCIVVTALRPVQGPIAVTVAPNGTVSPTAPLR